MRNAVLPWAVVGLVLLSMSALTGLWVWSRQRAAQREEAEIRAVLALEWLAQLQKDFKERTGSYSSGSVASLVAHSMPSPSVDMPSAWQEIYDADAQGSACPTRYGYLFEALPAKGILFRAFPAKGENFRSFAVDDGGHVLTK